MQTFVSFRVGNQGADTAADKLIEDFKGYLATPGSIDSSEKGARLGIIMAGSEAELVGGKRKVAALSLTVKAQAEQSLREIQVGVTCPVDAVN
jgi:hypothetical protein